jgi:hypothetical protein
MAYGGPLARRPLVVALPRLTEGGNNRQLPQALGRLWRVQRVEEVEAILAHGLRIGVAFGLPLRQPRILDPFAIPCIPGQGGQSLEPGGGHGGEFVERGAQRLGHEFKTVHHADGGEHMGRVGALASTGREEPQRATPLQQLVS